MDIDRKRAGTGDGRTEPVPATDDLVPMLRFVAGTCRAVTALLRFCIAVAREPGLDPLLREPPGLRRA